MAQHTRAAQKQRAQVQAAAAKRQKTAEAAAARTGGAPAVAACRTARAATRRGDDAAFGAQQQGGCSQANLAAANPNPTLTLT